MANSGNTRLKRGSGGANLPVIWESATGAHFDLYGNDSLNSGSRSSSAPPDLGIHQLLGILKRRKLLIFSLMVIAAILSGAVALVVPPKYTAKAQIIVEPDQYTTANVSAAAVRRVDELMIDTQMTLLTSRGHLREVHASLKNHPVYKAEAGTLESEVGDSEIGKPEVEKPEVRELAEPLLDGTLNWEGIKARVEVLANQQWSRVLQLRSQLMKPTGWPSFEEFEDRLRIDQERRSRVLAVRYTSNSPDEAAAVVNSVVATYVNGQVKRQQDIIKAEMDGLKTKIADVEQTMASTETRIRAQLKTSSSETQSTSVIGTSVRQLERQIADTEHLYAALLQRQKELQTFQYPQGPAVRALFMATPPVRSSSLGLKFFILPAIVLALIGGAVLAVVRESFDDSLRSTDQVQNALGVPCIAMVPKLERRTKRRLFEYLVREPYSPYAEAVRSIGAALHLSGRNKRSSQIVQVTSAVRGEGKTTLAVSLAVYATRLHRRVLLVDLDFRNPSIMKAMGLEATDGIVDLVASGKRLADVVQRVPELGLDILPMTSCPVDPVTLFSSGELKRTLNKIKRNYDLVIIDGPPMLGVTEASLLAGLSNTVLFLVKWGSTRRNIAQNAFEEFQTLGLKDELISRRVRAVISQVDLKQHARYRFGDAVEIFAKHDGYYNRNVEAKSMTELHNLKEQDADATKTIRMAAE